VKLGDATYVDTMTSNKYILTTGGLIPVQRDGTLQRKLASYVDVYDNPAKDRIFWPDASVSLSCIVGAYLRAKAEEEC
jgi:hypothetical protein